MSQCGPYSVIIGFMHTVVLQDEELMDLHDHTLRSEKRPRKNPPKFDGLPIRDAKFWRITRREARQ